MTGAKCGVRSARSFRGVGQLLVLAMVGVTGPLSAQAPRTSHPAPRTSNVILVVLDGVPWQEVYRRADVAQ